MSRIVLLQGSRYLLRIVANNSVGSGLEKVGGDLLDKGQSVHSQTVVALPGVVVRKPLDVLVADTRTGYRMRDE